MEIEQHYKIGVKELWRDRPGMLQSPFSGPVIPEDEAFRILQVRCSAGLASKATSPLRAFHEGRRIENTAPYLPAPRDSGFESYFARIERKVGSHSVGLCLSEPQTLSGALFRRLLKSLHTLSEGVKDSAHFVSTDLFILNRETSLFGIHKDSQDVFTFVIQGRRRYSLWPFHALAGIAGLSDEHRLSSHSLRELPPAAITPPVATFDVSAGDLMYWPADWWHKGEATDNYAISLGIGIRRDAHPLRFLIRAADQLLERGEMKELDLQYGTDWTRIQQQYNAYVRRMLNSGELINAVRAELMRSISAAGIMRLPPPEKSAEFGDNVRLRQVSTGSIAWAAWPDSEQLTCYVAGSELRLKPSADVLYILKVLALGEEEKAERLIQRAASACTGKTQAEATESARSLLKQLEQLHGIERV